MLATNPKIFKCYEQTKYVHRSDLATGQQSALSD